MPTHVLHREPKRVSEMVSMMSETKSGVTLTAAKKRTELAGARSAAMTRYKANPAKNVNAPTASNEMGRPPQYWVLNNAEYELYIAVRHASPLSLADNPGIRLQCKSCSRRSRCAA